MSSSLYTSIVIYAILFGLIIYFQPNFIFKQSGDSKEFGIFTTEESVFPIMIIVLIISIISFYIGYLFF
jgi:hypothetical protein